MIRDQSVIICALARNCYNKLKKNIGRIEELAAFFQRATIIVVENDSYDGTKELLFNWAKSNKDVIVLSSVNEYSEIVQNSRKGESFPPASLSRINRIAYYRNKYLAYIVENRLRADYVIMIDSDIDWFSPDKVINAIVRAPSDWSGIFANGRVYFKFFCSVNLSRYYDSFAFRAKGQSILLNGHEMRRNVDILEKALQSQEYVECESAFGGIGIYRYDCLTDNYYCTLENGRSRSHEAICEHIMFNSRCSRIGKLYICAACKVMYEESRNIPDLIFPANLYMTIYKILKGKEFPS